MRDGLALVAAFLGLTLAYADIASAQTFHGPAPYLSNSDSPFGGGSFDYFHLEDFEDASLDAPGLTASTGGVVSPAVFADSVDGDDGTIDGSGNSGHSFSPGASTNVRFTFDAGVLGALPTHAGMVWTDAGINTGPTYGIAQVAFEAFGADGTSLGSVGPFTLGDGVTNGETAEDRFFGIDAPAGISAIEMSINSQDWEIDHVQFGRTPTGHFQCYKAKDSKSDFCAAGSPSNAGAECTVETDCGGVDGDTAHCVKATPVKGVALELEDEAGTGRFGPTKLIGVCDPADKNGEGIVDADTWLLAYKIKPSKTEPPQTPHAQRLSVPVLNQFHEAGELSVDTVKVDRLLVPAAASDAGPVPAPEPASHGVDHYKCYKIKVSKDGPKFQRIQGVTVGDDFTEPDATYDLVKPSRLCLPVEKTILPSGEPEPIRNAADSLLCYRGKLAKTVPPQEKHAPFSGLFAADQLGPEVIDTKKSEELCVPSQVSLE